VAHGFSIGTKIGDMTLIGVIICGQAYRPTSQWLKLNPYCLRQKCSQNI